MSRDRDPPKKNFLYLPPGTPDPPDDTAPALDSPTDSTNSLFDSIDTPPDTTDTTHASQVPKNGLYLPNGLPDPPMETAPALDSPTGSLIKSLDSIFDSIDTPPDTAETTHASQVPKNGLYLPNRPPDPPMETAPALDSPTGSLIKSLDSLFDSIDTPPDTADTTHASHSPKNFLYLPPGPPSPRPVEGVSGSVDVPPGPVQSRTGAVTRSRNSYLSAGSSSPRHVASFSSSFDALRGPVQSRTGAVTRSRNSYLSAGPPAPRGVTRTRNSYLSAGPPAPRGVTRTRNSYLSADPPAPRGVTRTRNSYLSADPPAPRGVTRTRNSYLSADPPAPRGVTRTRNSYLSADPPAPRGVTRTRNSYLSADPGAVTRSKKRLRKSDGLPWGSPRHVRPSPTDVRPNDPPLVPHPIFTRAFQYKTPEETLEENRLRDERSNNRAAKKAVEEAADTQGHDEDTPPVDPDDTIDDPN
ncbi:hypothetical protein EDC01DRAFT_746916 [Geopyxis carbonaria]|nr:hypothetical protein EDC01DRAFT_746916 [Geopyxis carbonaria]